MNPEGIDRVDPEEMRGKGFTIDDHVYPWVAYKGPRFSPTEWYECFTDLESELMYQINELQLGKEALIDEINNIHEYGN
jgi:hypothetical protein